MGRGTVDGASVLYGPARPRRRNDGIYLVDGLAFPVRSTRPQHSFDVHLMLEALREHYDDSSEQMFRHILAANQGCSVDELPEDPGPMTFASINEDFHRRKEEDSSLPQWELDLAQWDICLLALARFHRENPSSGLRNQVAELHQRLSKTSVEKRGNNVLCSAGIHVISYRSVSGERWRPGFGYCGYICGECLANEE